MCVCVGVGGGGGRGVSFSWLEHVGVMLPCELYTFCRSRCEGRERALPLGETEGIIAAGVRSFVTQLPGGDPPSLPRGVATVSSPSRSASM